MRNLEDDKTIRREAYDSEDYYFLPKNDGFSEKQSKRRRGKRKVEPEEVCKGGKVGGKASRRRSRNDKSEDDSGLKQDAPDSDADYCLASVPPVYDLHISEVCQILYGGVD